MGSKLAGVAGAFVTSCIQTLDFKEKPSAILNANVTSSTRIFSLSVS